MTISVAEVGRQIRLILTSWGMSGEPVEMTVAAMLYADAAGIDSHGLSMLMMYEAQYLAGKLDLAATPRIIREGPATALIDAGAGLGHPAGVIGMRLAMQKARVCGIAAVSVFNSNHFGAAGYYAQLASAEGLVGFVTSSAQGILVVPAGGTEPVLGTNPIAFAAPARRHGDFLLDMATSTVAANKVKVYDLNQKPIPPGWVLDETGKTVTDSAQAMAYLFERDEGGLTALGGTETMGAHKGYGLSLMVQILSACLSGASFSPLRKKTQKAGDPDNSGHFLLALDPAVLRPLEAFSEDVDQMIGVLHATPPADPVKPVLVAGEPEALMREKRAVEGIPIPESLARKIKAICERCGAPFLLG
jgi:LDH2 family malate/lactate/ureidoglycolate dehydrogenase